MPRVARSEPRSRWSAPLRQGDAPFFAHIVSDGDHVAIAHSGEQEQEQEDDNEAGGADGQSSAPDSDGDDGDGARP